jgi:hypothetical protein
MTTVQISGGVLHNLSADLRKAHTSDGEGTGGLGRPNAARAQLVDIGIHLG